MRYERYRRIENAEEQDEITARFAAAGEKWWIMLNELIKAASGDLSCTWADAEALLP